MSLLRVDRRLVSIRFKRSYGNGSRVTMNPDPYRGIWGGRHCRDSPVQTTRSCQCLPDQCHASDRYIEQLNDVLHYEVHKKKVAAIFIESIQVSRERAVRATTTTTMKLVERRATAAQFSSRRRTSNGRRKSSKRTAVCTWPTKYVHADVVIGHA
jgi:hypothetical protein